MASNLPASKSGLYADPREDWLALHSEDVIDPARRIVDPHHHLWDRGGQRYLIWRPTSPPATMWLRPSMSRPARCIARAARKRCARSARSNSRAARRR
jgi:hypothetical protein